VEDALGHPRENVHHGVDAVLLVLAGERHHTEAVAEELPVEELVHHVHLSDDVDEAEELAQEVPDGVHIVKLQHKKTESHPLLNDVSLASHQREATVAAWA